MKRRATISSLIILAITLLLAVSAYSENDPFRTLGKQQAEALQKYSEDDVVALANGQPILRADYEYQLAEMKYANVKADKILKDAAEFPQAQEKILKHKQLGEKFSPEAKALANVLSRELMYQEALKKGLKVSEEEIKDYIDWAKENMKMVRSKDAQFNEFVNTIGEDKYLEEILPKKAKQLLLISKLKKQITEGVSPDNINSEWLLYQASLIKKADIELIDPTLTSATVEEAAKSLEALANLK
ncbi:MAG: hypothetical protein XD50_1346 [Clostridia bacterium 41_269]|nr:MAG: hypothetical protein XD50_1346 [Clostridia bacterium 41_269]